MGAPLADDTPRDIEALQIEGWRKMSDAQIAALVTSSTRAANDMAMAGIRAHYPEASPREQFLRLAVLKFGPELARSAYPELDNLPE